ncbi:hypothetical protein [Streptomyces iconiensis]|uniref:Immunity protein 50 n=1 Tax=Streptomyces iconiensis TaxID=1384038 RepID=A0ABT7A250_9ACTN|nr:hypothetical protein [Streptomyces iconiensis]MDJ1135397.1 hypothetical protein [Streptomyces iconiensis]
MAELIAESTRYVGVEFHEFCVQEADVDLVPVPFPDDADDWEGSSFLRSFEMRVDVRSGGHTHSATLTSQIWDARPEERPDAVWEAGEETQILCPSGELSFVTVSGAQPEPLELGVLERQWGLRVYCRGRDEAAVLAREGVPHGVEQYLLRFWPL